MKLCSDCIHGVDWCTWRNSTGAVPVCRVVFTWTPGASAWPFDGSGEVQPV